MTAPTFADAKARRLVAIRPPHREPFTGRLFALPGDNRTKRRSHGAKARVLLPSGAVLSVPVDQLDVLPQEVSA